MSEFKTRAEMAVALEFIQYLEVLKSGAVDGTNGGAVGTDGINRALERFAENDNALLEELNATRFSPRIIGNLSYISGELVWGPTSLTVTIFSQLTGVTSNVILSGLSPVPVGPGEVAYFLIDRTGGSFSVGAILVDSFADFLTALAGASDRMDYVVLAMGLTTGAVALSDGRFLREGYGVTNSGATENQYGQQTEVTLVRENQKENLKLIITEGGILAWDASGTPEFSWTQPIKIEFPASTGENVITTAASPLTIPAGHAAYVTLDRDPGASSPLTILTASLAAGVPDGDDIFVLAVHKTSDSRLYLWNGQSFSDGDSALLGGLRSGVQWFYNEPGVGAQVTDFASVLGPNTTYTIGSGELMVYRNGKKALNVSGAYWSGNYPGGAGLVGIVSPWDEYLEEDNTGTGEGSRIIWLRDDAGGGEVQKHAAGTHDPPWTWPQADDYIQAFIGIMGNGPSPVEGLGIEPEPGGGPLEGQVKLEAGTNISLVYNLGSNAITINQDGAGTELELDGGSSGSQFGTLLLKEPGLVDIDDSVAGEFSFDVADPHKDALVQAENQTPSTSNPYATLDALSPIQGFDHVYMEETSGGPYSESIRTYGGRLISDGNVYISDNATGFVEAGATDLYSGDAIINGTWHYVYLAPGGSPGDKPVMEISNTAPTFGRHGLDVTRKFITSVYVTSGGDAVYFSKRRGWVELHAGVDVSAAFAGLNTSGWQSVDLYGVFSYLDLLPLTGVKLVRLSLQVNVDTGPAGLHYLSIRAEGSTLEKSWALAEPTSNQMRFEILAPVGTGGGFEILFGGDYNNPPVVAAHLHGYSEGYETADDNLGAAFP